MKHLSFSSAIECEQTLQSGKRKKKDLVSIIFGFILLTIEEQRMLTLSNMLRNPRLVRTHVDVPPQVETEPEISVCIEFHSSVRPLCLCSAGQRGGEALQAEEDGGRPPLRVIVPGLCNAD